MTPMQRLYVGAVELLALSGHHAPAGAEMRLRYWARKRWGANLAAELTQTGMRQAG